MMANEGDRMGFRLIGGAMALMGLKLWELASLALPMLTNAPGIC